MRVIAPTFQLPQPLWPAWHTRHELVRCSESLRLLPGDPPEQPADAWPSFLFLFRAVHGDLRISEVRSVSEMLGYAGGRIAPTGHGVAPEQLPIVESIGGDRGPSIFQYVSFPDEAAAAAVARRCVMVRGVYEVWADFECDEADSGDQSWQRLASMLAEAPEAQKARMLAPLGSDSWRVDVRSFGRRKPYSLAQKRRLMDHLAELLWRIPGDVDLADSSERVTLLEDYRRGKADGPGDGGPCRLLLGRRVCAGAGRLLYTYALPRRHHLSRTALPPDLSFLMANQAHVRAGSLVLDPFCGSGSLLLSAAHFGAATVGLDISAAELNATGVAKVRCNFEEQGLPPPELLITADAAGLVTGDVLPAEPGSRYASFDAIITDPPYGIMEGLGALYVPLPQRVRILLQIAAARLKVGGRLAFLLPVPAAAAPPPLPHMDCLRLEGTSRQPISLRMHRLLVTMRKTAPPSAADLRPPTEAEASAWSASADAPRMPLAAAAGDPAAVAPWLHPSWLELESQLAASKGQRM